MNVQRLEGFYWVARLEGYARAARAFPYPISQPGVHQQVRRLEDELGVELFERVGRDRVVPTAAGRALYAAVAPFFSRLPDLITSLRDGSFGGTLRLGAASLMLRHLLPAAIQRLRRARPNIVVELGELETPSFDTLLDGRADLLVDCFSTQSPGIELAVIGTAHTFVALPPRHPLSRRRRLSIADLAGEPFVAYSPTSGGHALQLRAFAEAGAEAHVVATASSAETILGFVAAGVGVSLVPWVSAAGPRQAGVTVRAVGLEGARFPIQAAWRHGHRSPHVAAALAALGFVAGRR